LLATIPIALMADMMVWGGRARMYSLLILLIMLVVHFAYQSTLSAQPRRDRLLAILFFGGALLAHFNAILLTPALILAMIVVQADLKALPSIKNLVKTYWPEVISLGIVLTGAVLVKRFGQPKGAQAYDEVVQEKGLAAAWDAIRVISRAYGELGFGWEDGLGKFALQFANDQWLPLMILLLVGCGYTAYQFIKYRANISQRTRFLLFLCVIWLTTLILMLTVVSNERRDPKYLTMIVPFLSLIVMEVIVLGAAWLSNRLPTATRNRLLRLQPLWLILAVIALAAYYLPGSFRVFTGQELGYNHTMRYVSDRRQPGDLVLTSFTPACSLYLNDCDYYATQDPAQRRILEVEEDEVDRWSGASILDNEADFEAILRATDRVWFITDRWRLDGYYDAPFRNLIFSQMRHVDEDQDSIVFLKDGPFQDIQPDRPLAANLDNQLELWGYDLNDTEFEAGEAINLTLYWKTLARPQADYTIFVHLRDQDNSNLAQFDFQPFDGTFPTSAWRPGEIVQLPVTIHLPESTTAGEYRLLMGMYLLATLDRIPVIGDQSGENAVILTNISVN
jgi:hypothetical protein